MKVLIAAASLASLATAAPSLSIGTIHDGSAPILSASNAEVVADHYIVKFKEHVTESGFGAHQAWIQDMHTSNEDRRFDLRKRSQMPMVGDSYDGVKHTYNLGKGFMGYSGHFHEDVIEQVRNHPDVDYIERDSIVHTMTPIAVEDECPSELEKNAPWGLARLSHRNALNFGTFNKYNFATEGGEGVDAYVIDTGTNIEHVDFEGRAKWGKTIPAGDEDEDGNGHGTHCSGTIAGKKYGVAKKANVYAVKVLRSNGSGSMSDVIKGVEFAAKSHVEQVGLAKKGKRKNFKGSVANMSLGGGKVRALDNIVNAAVATGMHFAVAAGNDNADACNYSPAAAEQAITVGASALDDSRAYFSNYGKCTDIFAPGLSILSTWIGSEHAVNTISGTSMASPHIAGLLAYYLSLQPAIGSEFYAPLTPKKLKANVLSIATQDALTDIPDETPNLLAWNGGGCKDYDSIIKKGGFKARQSEQKASSPSPAVSDLEKVLAHDFEIVGGLLSKKIDKLMDKVEDLMHESHH